MSAPTPLRCSIRAAAFTLLELLAVIGVIAILTGIVIGVGRRAAETGRTARARAELAVLSVALEAYKAAHGDYPRTADPAQMLQALIGKRAADMTVVAGRSSLETSRFHLSGDPYGTEAAVLLDPWEQPYRYAYRSTANWTNPSYVLVSAGPDQLIAENLLSGGFIDPTATVNTDNIAANSGR